MRHGRLMVGLLLSLGLVPVAAAADLDQMAENLAGLRREVEVLSTELGLQKEDLRGRLRAMDAQKADLQVQVRQQELRMEQLDQAVEREKALRAEVVAEGQALTPAVQAGIGEIRTAVAASLPFRLQERLDELDDIEAGLLDQTLTPREAAQRLWSFSEDELRLTRENALDRQVIELDGQEQLVDVARLGMVAIYYRTDDGQVGWAERTDTGWVWQPAPDSAASLQVLELFDALEKQIRVGYFVLPDALGEVVP